MTDFDEVVAEYHRAAGEFVKGNPIPYEALFSQGEDVTLANPFGPVVRGWERVAETMERAAANYRDGEITSFENVATYVSDEVAYIVEVERLSARLGGGEDLVAVALRTTSILRREDGAWKIVHRHADPIITARSVESLVQR